MLEISGMRSGDARPAHLPMCNLSKYAKVLIGASIRFMVTSTPACSASFTLIMNTVGSSQCGVLLREPDGAQAREADTADQCLYEEVSAPLAWKPKTLGVFAGALRYSRHNWWQTRIIQLIMMITGAVRIPARTWNSPTGTRCAALPEFWSKSKVTSFQAARALRKQGVLFDK